MDYATAPRVLCLYRVSTKHQVENNDIPMQRKECRAFCHRKGWQLYREIDEMGVSGYSLSLSERDAIQTIKDAALHREFDIFLVYMFDRIGRKEFEVPAFLRFLVEHGISVWSTQEGEQRFENDADSILAMLRSFTAQRESMKLSTRVHTKHMQMALAGEYRGGRIPYGYKLRESSKINRKGSPIRELIIDEAQAAIIRTIFEKRVYDRMGVYEIAKMLCEMTCTNESEPSWRASTISYILSNRVYIGQLKFDGNWSMPYEHLRIISNELFQAAQRKSQKQKAQKAEKETPKEFYDLLFCAHCQGHLIYNAVHKVTTPDGKVNTREVYRCYNKLRYASPCTGQATYAKKRVDRLVLEEVKQVIHILVNADEETLIRNATEKELVRAGVRISTLITEKAELEGNIKHLQTEMIQASKTYGIEATTNLQIIIADALSRLAILKEQLTKERSATRKRANIHNRYQTELQKLKQRCMGYEHFSEDSLLALVPAFFIRVCIGSGYTIQTIFTPLIESYLL